MKYLFFAVVFLYFSPMIMITNFYDSLYPSATPPLTEPSDPQPLPASSSKPSPITEMHPAPGLMGAPIRHGETTDPVCMTTPMFLFLYTYCKSRKTENVESKVCYDCELTPKGIRDIFGLIASDFNWRDDFFPVRMFVDVQLLHISARFISFLSVMQDSPMQAQPIVKGDECLPPKKHQVSSCALCWWSSVMQVFF